MRSWIARLGVGVAVFCIFGLPAGQALAWGPQAHRAIALIADRILEKSDPAAHAKLRALLATDKENRFTKTDIASEATWADVLIEKSEEARYATLPWHSARLKADNPDLAAACFGRKALPEGYPASHGPRENCVVDKVAQFQAELQNPDTAPGERVAALQFLLNLVGDLHDPLEAIDYGDQGGRCVALQVGPKPPVRLSAYWQETLLNEVVGHDPAKGAAQIVATVPQADLQKWADGKPEEWLRETHDVAKAVTYGFPRDKPAGKQNLAAGKGDAAGCGEADLYRVGLDYETKALAAVKLQLAKAGARLAFVLRTSLK
ncbi:MAG TPA: S1/P1 nuclease [Stellaceae bacterium]